MVSKSWTNSSTIEKTDYDELQQELVITFKTGGKYKYFAVPLITWEEILETASIGSYFHKNIKDKFQFEKLS